jgi:TonB-linked SusC/RagA family outer membrane protein
MDYFRRKQISAMLLFFALLLPISMVAMEQNNGVFSFKLQDVTVKDIFKYIEKNSEYIFLYSTDKNLLKKINVDVNKKDITQVLDEILKNTTLIYDIDGKQIIIREKNASEKSQQKTTQKKKTIRGIVSDDSTQEPIIGATIRVNGSMTGTTSNIEGDFVLECAVGDTLTVSFVGYQDRSVLVKSGNIYAIALKESAAELGEVVVTAFGVGQKKESLVGSIQQIKPQELKVPSSSLSTAFAGRMAGVIAVQRSGEPGADGANFWIRGKSTFNGNTSALIIMDGVEISSTELNALDPEVIESFSILKDATATALYGTRGANGVMIVATKNGKNLDKPIINFRLEGAISTMTRVPNMVDGPTYMKMFNEAVSRPGCDVSPYSQEKIDGTIAGLNPYIYPNVDWFDEIFNKSAFSERANFNIRGGSSKMDYFMSASFKHSNGHLKSLSKDYFSYNNNVRNYNYDFINNLNISATRTTKISLGLNLSVADKKSPLMDVNDIFQLSMEANPVDFPVRFPANMSDRDFVLWGDKPGGIHGQGWYRNPVAEYVTGYKTNLRTTITANFKLAQELDMITKGLKFTGLFSFKNYSSSSTERSASYNHYYMSSYDPSSMEYKITRIGDEQSTALTNDGSRNGDRKMYFQAILDYNRIFKEVHDLNIMFLYNQEQYDINGPTTLFSSLPQRKQGVAGRVSYSYDGRYYIEGNFGYNGSENFAKGHRFGFFPSIAVGYNISNEKFWQPIKPVISNLKIRGSWGLVGNDATNAGRFAYMEDLVLGGSDSYTTGIRQDTYYSGPSWNRYFNPDLTWEVGEKINLGLDLQLFNDFNLTFDIFMTRENSIPEIVGTGETKITSNNGEMENKGLDLAIDYNKQITKDFFLSFKSTLTFARNKVLKMDESPYFEYPGLSDVGHPLGTYWGYVADGLFPDQETIDNSPRQDLGYTPQPGDIKYVNQPNAKGEYDNVINSNDRVAIGHPYDPELVYGFGPSMKWKNWDFSFFFQGVARTSFMMYGMHPFGTTSIKNMLQFVADDHWSVDNPNPNAAYPRLTKDSNGNNDQYSTYWLRNAAFLKLKNAEIGYTYKGMRFYLSGVNLLTFSPFKHWDPEMGGGNGLYYPTQRVFNIGFQMTIQ